MARPIDANALIKSIESDRNCSDMPSQWIDGVNYAIDLIELYEPTIDAVSVEHGEWIKRHGTINCSVCKRSNWSACFEDTVRSFNFCPNCGARMKGADDEVR